MTDDAQWRTMMPVRWRGFDGVWRVFSIAGQLRLSTAPPPQEGEP